MSVAIQLMVVNIVMTWRFVLVIFVGKILAQNCILVIKHTHTHTHPFNSPLSGTTQVSRYRKGKTNLDFTAARDSERQWYQLGHMQVCTSFQTDIAMLALHHSSFFTGRMPFLPPSQQCQSTEGSSSHKA